MPRPPATAYGCGVLFKHFAWVLRREEEKEEEEEDREGGNREAGTKQG